MEKRVVLAVALSIFIIIGFQYFVPKPNVVPTAVNERLTLSESVKEDGLKPASTQEVFAEEQVLAAETDKYILNFSNIGGAIKSVYMKEFKAAGSSDPLELIKIDNPIDYIFNLMGQAYLDTSVYSIVKDKDTIICYLKTQDFEITKRYILHNLKYIIELQLFVKNTSTTSKEFNYQIIGGSGISEANEKDRQFIEVTSKVDGKVLGFKRPKAGRITHPGAVDWEALKNKYFSIILKPLVNTRSQFYGINQNGSLVMGLEPLGNTIQPGSSIENKFILYIGPSQAHLLKSIGHGFEETINYGFFGAISKILISTMRFFYNIVHSWGIAIILLSVFLNIILFPLTLKSFKSMQKMQEIHPQMEKLKKQLKDNPQKLNKEILDLYKKYNINPFSGCLPMLLQMPVFIALYQALMKSVELRSASFLWIKDLSLPDAVPIPVSLPLIGSSINILPIIMIIAMFVQQKISTKSMGAAVTDEQKQQQKIMLIMMPVMFGFIFYNMPSGLVLYWVVSTLLTLTEQSLIAKG